MMARLVFESKSSVFKPLNYSINRRSSRLTRARVLVAQVPAQLALGVEGQAAHHLVEDFDISTVYDQHLHKAAFER